MRKWKVIVPCALSFLLGIAVGLFLFRGGSPVHAGGAFRPEIILYSEPDFQGRELHLFDTAVDIPYEQFPDGTQFLWNDNIGSIIMVSGTWRLYQHGRMNTALDDTPPESFDVQAKTPIRGWSNVLSATTLGSLQIASLSDAGIDADISSIELVSQFNLPDWLFNSR